VLEEIVTSISKKHFIDCCHFKIYCKLGSTTKVWSKSSSNLVREVTHCQYGGVPRNSRLHNPFLVSPQSRCPQSKGRTTCLRVFMLFSGRAYKPPMATVKVTPIIADSVVVVPSMLRPRVASFDIMYAPIAPTLPSISALFNAWRAGNSNGAESSRPALPTTVEVNHTRLYKISKS